MPKDNQFYLGRIVDAEHGQTTGEPLYYDPPDLTTHAVVVGMTGSGKTGLCIDLLEEAALNDIPALMIDPKGDITNAVLHFPNLAPADFAPWINADEARRDGKTVEQAATATADLWRNGLAQWDITPERIQALKDSAQFTIYTPGSDAGIPISILSSLAAPALAWAENTELLRERISGTVTALLGLIGLTNIDPVRSREHILLANIFEHAWSQGRDMTLAELILQTQNPPFDKLGVFDVNMFFPEKDRFTLALSLNNILAAPAFQVWIEGEPLDIPRLLRTANGRPRHTIFYLAHLNDAERMFFVTLLYSAVETWMRTQKGTGSLRALIYFDEIFGYLPPSANPPSKEPMLRLLKQARAFGVGLVLASQNPVDIDYKALSNAGTWFIGKLATEQDKNRLLDGLESAMGAGLDRRTYDRLISTLGKRVFLLRNVHEKAPQLFQTRWAMNYLAGPMTRAQIPALNALAGAARQLAPAPAAATSSATAPPAAPGAAPPADELPGSRTRPAVPGRVEEYFLPHTLTLNQAAKADRRDLSPDARPLGLLYRPVLLARADIRINNRKYGIDAEFSRAVLVVEPDRRGSIHWEEHEHRPIAPRDLDRRPEPEARFAALEPPLTDASAMKELERDFQDWAYRAGELTIRANEALGVYAGPDESDQAFADRCRAAARTKAEEEFQKLTTRFDRQLDSLRDKLAREERELQEDEAEYQRRKLEEGAKHIDTLLGLLGGRRRSVSGSLSKRSMTARAKEDVDESVEAIADFKKELEALQQERDRALDEIRQRWDQLAGESSEVKLQPYKKDVTVSLYGVAWFPYHLVQDGRRTLELPGFGEG